MSQINSCVNYPTSEMDKIDFPSDEVVEKHLRAHGNESEKVKKMDVLNYELNQRKELNEQVKNLTKTKNDNFLVLKEREKFYKELPGYLANLENSTLKAQSFLNLKVTENNNNISKAEKLPPALYVLYNSLLCVNTEEVQYDVKIMGREDQVEDFYKVYSLENIPYNSKGEINNDSISPVNLEENHDNREEGEHSDNDGEEKNEKLGFQSKKLKRRRKKPVSQQPKNLRHNKAMPNVAAKVGKFPLSIQFNIQSFYHELVDDILPITINFFFVPIFNIITAEVSTNNLHFTTEHFLSNLFVQPANLSFKVKQEVNSALGKTSIITQLWFVKASRRMKSSMIFCKF